MYCLIELENWGDFTTRKSIVMISKSKEELEHIKLLLIKKYNDIELDIIEL